MWQDELVRFTLVSDVDRVDIYSPQYLVASSWWIHIWCACVCGTLIFGLGFWRRAPSRGEHVCLIQRLLKMTAVGFEPTPFRTGA